MGGLARPAVISAWKKDPLGWGDRRPRDQGDLPELRVSRKVVPRVVRAEATEFRYERENQPLPRLASVAGCA